MILSSTSSSSSSSRGHRFVVLVISLTITLLPLVYHYQSNGYTLQQFLPTTTTFATTSVTDTIPTANNNNTATASSSKTIATGGTEQQQQQQAISFPTNDQSTAIISSSVIVTNNNNDDDDHNSNNNNNNEKHNTNDTSFVYCLRDKFGRNCNSIIQIANTLYKAHHHNQQSPLGKGKGGNNNNKVGLRPGDWTERYIEFFDPRDDILLNYTGTCHAIIPAKRAHFSRPKHKPNWELVQLIPKLEIRQAAEHAIRQQIEQWQSNGIRRTRRMKVKTKAKARKILSSQPVTATTKNDMNSTDDSTTRSSKMPRLLSVSSSTTPTVPPYPFVSVHRRWLEGSCHTRSSIPGENYCISTNHDIIVEDKCEIVYDNITQDYHRRRQAKLSKEQYQEIVEMPPVLLFTDGQQREFDQTFPWKDNHPFAVQLWMMTLSPIHYGNPVSSVDHVVNHWRQGVGMEPSECFPPFLSSQ